MKQLYVKPALLHHQDEYLTWLGELVRQIRTVDPVRPVTLDVPLDDEATATLHTFSMAIPEISCLGLAVPNDTADIGIPETTIPCFISGIGAGQYIATGSKRPVFINAWQDQQNRDAITFNGLLDHERHRKPAYFQLAHYWNTKRNTPRMPAVKILRSAQLTEPGRVLSYHALVYNNGKWKLDDPMNETLNFKWFLYKTDGWGNAIYMRQLGTGVSIDVTIPDLPGLYRLYLVVSKNGSAVSAHSTLNTPFSKAP